MKIVIDPGHGGKDPGATSKYGTEADSNLRCALLLERELKEWGTDVTLTRRNNNVTNFQGAQRANVANKLKADLLISLHADSASAPNPAGHHIIVSLRGTESKRLGQLVSDYMAATTGVKAFRVPWTKALSSNPRSDWYAIIRNAKMPTILIERGFLSNDVDAKRLFDESYLLKQAQGIAVAVAEYAKLPRVFIEKTGATLPLKLIDGKSYPPLRASFENLGYSVHWKQSEKKAIIR